MSRIFRKVQCISQGLRDTSRWASTQSAAKYESDMASIDLQNEVAAFFDEFVAAFREFDGQLIAKRYIAPYLAMHTDESVGLLASQGEIGQYFQSVVNSYHERGCRSCRYTALEVVSLGTRCALATVTWDLLLQNGMVLTSWRESYNLVRSTSGLRIFASVDHAS